LGQVQLDKITPLGIQDLYTSLHSGRNLSAATVRKVHVILSSALDQAVRWGMLGHNPAKSVQLPRNNRGRRREQIHVLNAEQAIRFLDSARKNRWGAVFILGLNSGMRPSEMLGLKWDDVEWTFNLIRVRRTLYRRRNGGGWRFEETKTFGSIRSITLPQTTMAELARHQNVQARERLVMGDEYVDQGLVFAGIHGQPLDGANLLSQYFKSVVRSAGLDDKLNLYSLRHSHATLLLAAGVHPKVVAERLGHASIQLTLDTYSHVIPSMQQGAADRLEELLTTDPNDEKS
jgi:integrase